MVSKLTVWDENVGFIDRLQQFQDFNTSSVSERVIIIISVLHEPLITLILIFYDFKF